MADRIPQYPKLRPIEVTPVLHEGKKALAVYDPTRLSDGVVVVTQDLAYALQLMDGQHSLLDIRAAYLRKFGSFLFEDQLVRLVSLLDEHLLLDNERSAAHRLQVEAEFRNAPVRESTHAGQSYPEGAEELRQFLGHFFPPEGAQEPPFAPSLLRGCVVPHIDLRAGGPSYGRAYRFLSAVGPVDLFVILGTCHVPIPAPFAGTSKNFRTPLGLAHTDGDFMYSLGRLWDGDLFAGEIAHRYEHTIEFQVIFLQHVFGEIRIAPLLCAFSPLELTADAQLRTQVDRFAEALRQALSAYGGRVIVMASADLSHVGPRYGDPWAVDNTRLALVRSHDQEFIQAVLSGDAERGARVLAAAGNRFRVCGFPPIYTMLRALEAKGGVVLDYHHAVVDGSGSVVTFASIALY